MGAVRSHARHVCSIITAKLESFVKMGALRISHVSNVYTIITVNVDKFVEQKIVASREKRKAVKHKYAGVIMSVGANVFVKRDLE